MLFVLFVVGLLVSLTVPRFAAGYQQRELLAQRADIEDQLRELPRRVRLSAQPLQLPLDLKLPDLGDGSAPLHLPPGWEIAFDPALQISILGACSASSVSLRIGAHPALSAQYKLATISCELSTTSP